MTTLWRKGVLATSADINVVFNVAIDQIALLELIVAELAC
jgi:hypothetical protein